MPTKTGLIEPRRHLELEGATNIRDLGGYTTSDGRATRWKTLLRADSLHRLPQGSQAALIEYGVRTVIDLRKTSELQQQPDVFAASTVVDYHHQDMVPEQEMVADDVDLSVEGYRRIVLAYTTVLEERRPQVRRTLTTLSAPGKLPALFHCAGGKDRTGVISALLLGLAGVPRETIAEDYALSARYRFPAYLREVAPPETATSGYTWKDYQRDYCPAEAMRLTLEHLDDRFGGIEEYLLGGGFTREHIDSLRRAFVE